MRDPDRVDEILTLIGQIWKANPQFRFHQLLYILQAEYSEANAGFGKVVSLEIDGFKETGYDFFNLEDDKFQEYLHKSLACGTWSNNA